MKRYDQIKTRAEKRRLWNICNLYGDPGKTGLAISPSRGVRAVATPDGKSRKKKKKV